MNSPQFDRVIPETLSVLGKFNGRTCETTLVRDSFGTLTVVLPNDAL